MRKEGREVMEKSESYEKAMRWRTKERQEEQIERMEEKESSKIWIQGAMG